MAKTIKDMAIKAYPIIENSALQQLITEYSGWVNMQLQDIIKRRIKL